MVINQPPEVARTEPLDVGVHARVLRLPMTGDLATGLRDYGIVVAAVALFITLAVTSDVFLSAANLRNLVDQASSTGIVACAGTFVIIAGGFDLSVGAIFALSGVIAATLALSVDPVLGLVVGVLVGLGAGLCNGLIVTVGRVNAFIATLASSIVIEGIGVAVTGGSLITVNAASFAGLGNGGVASVKYSTWIFLAVVLVSAFALTRTPFGRYVFAVGGNAEAARFSGVRVGVMRAATFALSGLAAGLAGVIIASRNITGQADSGHTLALDAIAAIVIGGTSILGGEGAIWRTVVGVLLLEMIGNGFNLLSVNPTYQRMFEGGIILAAVVVDARARRRTA